MKRGIITNNEQGIHISDGEIWMTSWEIADLYYTTVGTIHAAIKRILKANILKNYEVCKYIKLNNGNNTDVYNLDMVIALSYQIDTGHSAAFRKWVINKVARKQEYNILLYLNKGTNHTLYC
ncbi:lipofamily protein [Bacteroides sp. KG123]|uniref:lipofamily protein n=1 Tax=unclassified Bacteroides TaxID=2646097 RepID=UPI003D7FABB9